MNLKYEHALAMCKNIVGIFITGSHAYGMNTPSSDLDMKAIAILPPELTFRVGEPVETLTLHPEDFERHPEFLEILGIDAPTDFEIHSLRKFLELAKKANPTILEMLFCEDRFIIKRTAELDLILKHRDAFLSKTAIGAFGGYARQQLIRIKHGVGIALDPKDEGLTKDLYDSMSRIVDGFNVNHEGFIAMSHYDAQREEDERIALEFTRPIYLPEAISLLTEIKQCRETYMALNAKNKRKDEGKMFKHAAHLIRLLEAGLELSKTGKLNVFRPDAAYLLEIRAEKYAMEDVITKASELFIKLDKSNATTVLPALADSETIDALYLEVLRHRFKMHY